MHPSGVGGDCPRGRGSGRERTPTSSLVPLSAQSRDVRAGGARAALEKERRNGAFGARRPKPCPAVGGRGAVQRGPPPPAEEHRPPGPLLGIGGAVPTCGAAGTRDGRTGHGCKVCGTWSGEGGQEGFRPPPRRACVHGTRRWEGNRRRLGSLTAVGGQLTAVGV